MEFVICTLWFSFFKKKNKKKHDILYVPNLHSPENSDSRNTKQHFIKHYLETSFHKTLCDLYIWKQTLIQRFEPIVGVVLLLMS